MAHRALPHTHRQTPTTHPIDGLGQETAIIERSERERERERKERERTHTLTPFHH